MVFPGGSSGKESACNVGDWGSIPGAGGDLLEKGLQPTPVFLSGGLQSMGLQRVGHVCVCVCVCDETYIRCELG